MYKIKNWDKFQHYKPKNAKHQQKMTWYKMYGADILNDHVYMKLSTTEKLFLREAWDLASQFDGTLPDIENCAFRLRQSENDLKKAYDNLSAKGFLLSSDGIEKVYTPSITIQASAEVIKNPSNDFEKWYLEVVKRQANILNIKIPEIGIFQSVGPNAFATGSSKNSSLIAISSGLISNMNKDEIEAVIGHEMSHVANGDMVTLSLIQGIVNAFVIFFSRVIGHFVDRVILKNERGYGIGYFFTVIFAQVVLGILASTIVMWYSRQREYRADHGGAELTSKEAMISSLRILAKMSSAKLPITISK